MGKKEPDQNRRDVGVTSGFNVLFLMPLSGKIVFEARHRPASWTRSTSVTVAGMLYHYGYLVATVSTVVAHQ